MLRSAWEDRDREVYDEAEINSLDEEIRSLTVQQHRLIRALTTSEASAATLPLQDALTRITNAKLRALETRTKLESERKADTGTIDHVLDALNGPDDYQP